MIELAQERGHRLMPRRFPSNMCDHCQEVESCTHRYLRCSLVSETWEWILSTSQVLEPSIAFVEESSLLRLNYPKGLRENAVLWLIGNYVELVEKEVICKDKKLDLHSVQGYLKQKKYVAYQHAIPDLGIIPGIDWDPQGIG